MKSVTELLYAAPIISGWRPTALKHSGWDYSQLRAMNWRGNDNGTRVPSKMTVKLLQIGRLYALLDDKPGKAIQLLRAYCNHHGAFETQGSHNLYRADVVACRVRGTDARNCAQCLLCAGKVTLDHERHDMIASTRRSTYCRDRGSAHAQYHNGSIFRLSGGPWAPDLIKPKRGCTSLRQNPELLFSAIALG